MRIEGVIAVILLALSLAAPASAQDAESQVYAAARSCKGLTAYLREYPNGRYRSDAQARIASDCTPRPTPTSTPQAVIEKPPPADPCAQARADWASVGNTQSVPVLRSFIGNTPSVCATLRTAAQERIYALDPVERRKVDWHGVPEFEGVWVSDSGTCGFFPWTFSLEPTGIRWQNANNTGSSAAWAWVQASPPTMTFSGAKLFAQSDGRLRYATDDGKTTCYARRQTQDDIRKREDAAKSAADEARSWTAIAWSDWKGFWTPKVYVGAVTAQTSKQAAEAAAVQECETAGHTNNCKVIREAWTRGCYAVAGKFNTFTESHAFGSFRQTEADASASALDDCNKEAKGGCKIERSICAKPGR